jgi:hypothetical protein
MLFLLQVGCATSQQLVAHAFSFDARLDSPGIEVLDYRYGESQVSGTSARATNVPGQVAQYANVNGPMLRGDSLYVKWRDKGTGVVYEESVDLRPRVPADIREHRIHFVVQGAQLFVYLISPQRRGVGTAPNGPRRYSHLDVLTIYPGRPPG